MKCIGSWDISWLWQGIGAEERSEKAHALRAEAQALLHETERHFEPDQALYSRLNEIKFDPLLKYSHLETEFEACETIAEWADESGSEDESNSGHY